MVVLSKDILERNFLEDKIEKINGRLAMIKNKTNIVVWGAGVHTECLFKYSDILQYDFKIVDNKAVGKLYNRNIILPSKVEWSAVSAVIISTHKFSNSIKDELVNKYNYNGEIVELYDSEDNLSILQLNKDKDNCFWGDFQSMEEAKKYSSIWDERESMNKEIEVVEALVNSPREFYWTYWLQKYMLWIYLGNNSGKHLSIIDFGGGLGQEYINNKQFFSKLNNVEYIVVDQKEHVSYGKTHYANNELAYADNIHSAYDMLKNRCSLIIMNSVLQYIEEWESFLDEVIEMKVPYILLGRQFVADRERITIQNIGHFGFSSCNRIFNEEKLLSILLEKYELADELEYYGHNVIFNDLKVKEKCYLLVHKGLHI